MTRGLLIVREDDCWTFTLDREEKRNALDADLVERLIDGVEEARVEGARIVAFRGNGKNFSAGFDFDGLADQSDGDLLLRFVRIEVLLQAVASLPALTIAMAHGRNFGAGVDLFAACKQRMCTSDATFRMPGLMFGLVLGSRRFAELVGRSTALDVLERAEVIVATRAIEIGLATRSIESIEWTPELVRTRAAMLVTDPPTRHLLHCATDPAMPDRDLAYLVRSAARPGLKQRIADYLQGQARGAGRPA